MLYLKNTGCMVWHEMSSLYIIQPHPHLFSVITKLGHNFLSFPKCDHYFLGSPNNTIPKSVALFAKSVNTNDVKATKCDSIEHFRNGACSNGERVTFGENVNIRARGIYYL